MSGAGTEGSDRISILTTEERDTVQAWIYGIDQRRWNPTPATKRHVAEILRRLLWADEVGGP